MNKDILHEYTKLNITHLNDDNIPKVHASLVDYAYKQTKLGLITSLFCASVIAYGIFSDSNKTTILSWFSLFLFVTLLRVCISYLYEHYKSTVHDIAFWKYLFIFGTFLGGVTWGLAAGILFPMSNQDGQVLIILILAGITAGAVPLLCAVLASSIAFLLPALLPLLISLLLSNNHAYMFFDIAAVAYTTYLIALSINSHRMIESSIKLKFENDILLKNLIKTKINLEHTATHDPLTNMANRNLFALSFSEAIKRAERHGSLIGLLYLDIDNFKNVNDLYGHDIGDKLLLNTVERLKNILRETDLISRLGGDEFTVLLEDVKHAESIIDIARKICQAFTIPMKINEYEINVTVSIGISIYPSDEKIPDKLLSMADKAMYYAKKQGHNNFHHINRFRHYSTS
jgi:diguanylate cyclase (GGDEF)-like protein